MSNSLQDALLKSGLVDEKRAKEAAQKKRKAAKQQRGGKKGAKPAPQAAPARQAKVARDRELNRRRDEEARQRALRAEIKQLIADHRLPKNDGEIAYNFADGTRVKRLYVTAAVQGQLGDGRAVIVKLHGQYDVVPRAAAEKIRERDVECIIVDNGAASGGDEDPYGDFPVPDDLMW